MLLLNKSKVLRCIPLLNIMPLCVLCSVMGVIWYFLPHPILLMALCILPIAALFALQYTFFILLLFIVFSFFRLHEVFPVLYSFKIPLLLSAGALFSLFWHLCITQTISVYWSRELTLLSIFFTLVVIGVVLSSNTPIALKYFKGVYWKIMLMMFAISWITRKPGHFSLASTSIVISGTLVGIVALMNKMNGIGLVEGSRVTIGRDIGSVLGDPNDLALALMFPIAFSLSIMVTKSLPRYAYYLGWVSTITLFSAVIATQSRGGLLGILTIFAIFGIKKIKSKLLLITLGIAVPLVLFLAAGISSRQSGGAAEEGLDASAQGRLYAWEAAIGMAVDRPLLGVGLDNFYYNYFFYSKHWDGINHAVHSTWFGVLAETGFLGLILFITIMVSLSKSAARSIRLIEQQCQLNHTMYACSQALFAGLVGTLVAGTFLTHGFTWPIYIFAGLIIAMARWVSEHCKL